MNHQIARWVFALAVGIGVAWFSYQWITNPAPRAERQTQEAVVIASREQLLQHLKTVDGFADVEVADPLAPNRRAGKVYVYRGDTGWEVSGYYRRNAEDRWHPYLMQLNDAQLMTHLKIQDAALSDTLAEHEAIEVLR